MKKHESARAVHDPRMALSYFPSSIRSAEHEPWIHLHVWEKIEQFYI